MEWLAKFLEAQPLLSLFLVVGVGYALGQINLKGFSLGVGAVLFSGLAVGAISPKAQPPALLGTLGMVLFLYGIGVQYGGQFFAGWRSILGFKYNLLAVVSYLIVTLVTIALMLMTKTPVSLMAGLFSGVTTTAAAMLAAMEAARTSDPAVSYSVAFPVGLLGTILCMYFIQWFIKPVLDLSSKKELKVAETSVEAWGAEGMAVSDVISRLPPKVAILAVRTGDKNTLPNPEHVLRRDDVLLLGSEDPAALDEACAMIGKAAPGEIVADRTHLDYLRVFASTHHVIGLRLAEIQFPEATEATIVQVRRGDADLMAAPDLVLEFGDRVGVLCHRDHFGALRKFFGDSIRGTTEFSYVSLGIGMVLGVIASIIPIPIPGVGTLKLGIAGGVLIVALVLGKLRRSGSLNWTMPLSANIILRNFGVSLFLAQIGMSSGQQFVSTVQQTGFSMLGLSVVLLLPLVVFPFIIGHYLMRIPFDDLMGILSGLAGNAAIIAYASKEVPSERVEIAYAMVYPGAIILKILIVQILIAVWTPSAL